MVYYDTEHQFKFKPCLWFLDYKVLMSTTLTDVVPV